ncbi:MAG: molecular chaperone HtpG [Clostridiales bacterium]|jgi:molecular chaperone HtpG|nr:molecular chaperone HtpG [Clostridiales bacterium]
MEKGNLSINSENILPIIKKWLYSDMEIFVRELVSNAADAINKLARLDSLGEATLSDDEKFTIKVSLDAAAKTITFSDNGIGMTADEIKKYINQIAFSGATDFIEQYKDKMEAGGDIIGHFGLGFYSAFMVADKVEIDTLSYKPGEWAARWTCDGGIEYEIASSDRSARGTDIILHIGESGEEFLNDYKLRQTLRKYCSFIPVEIYFENTATPPKEDEEPAPINDIKPLWTKRPQDCTDDEYKKFYSQLFMDFNEPLFWIHLNMDHPFRLKGILYFPRLKHELEYVEGQVKLFSNQVFVADNIKEVIPEFLLLLKGVMDCPDLPLNVSRSFLQNDGYVAKMSNYIVRKVADKLVSLATADREGYNKYWDDISQFIKYGIIRQEGFYEKVKDAVLYKTTGGEFFTLAEYLERNEATIGKKVIYTDDLDLHGQYVRLFEQEGVDIIMLGSRLDIPFTSHAEAREDGLSFVRIDADPSSILGGEAEEVDYDALTALFKESIGEDIPIDVQKFKNESTPAMIFISEEAHRMKEMSRLYGLNFGDLGLGAEKKLLLNSGNPLVKSLIADNLSQDDSRMICQHIWDMASLSHKHLDPERMERFIRRNVEILTRLTKV